MGLIGEVFADAGLHIDTASFAQYAAMLKQAEGQIGDMSSVMQAGMVTAFTVPAAAVAGIAAYGATIAASYEDANITLRTLYGSQEAAQEKFQWLADFAASTPFEFPELLDATIKLKAYGIEAQDYLGVLGDTASAMGKTVGDAVEALADAQTGEFERLKEFGVKAVVITKDNAERLGASINDIGKTALTYTDKNGKELIKVVDRNSREMITAALVGVDGIFTKYQGAMEERAKSINGMFSTIKDNLKAGLVDMIGIDMSTGVVEAGSLFSALQNLAKIALVVSGAFAGMSEPMQTFVLVAALGGAAALALAAGFVAATAAGITTAGVMAALAMAETLVLWPATLIVGTLALVAAGLVYLDEKTGIVTYSWNLMKDIFIIVADGIMRAVSYLWSYIVIAMDGIKQSISDMFPPGFLEGVENVVNGVVDQFTNMGDNIHNQAVEIGQDQDEIGNSAVEAGEKVETGTNDMKNGYDAAGLSALLAGGNTKTATDLIVAGTGAAGDSANDMKNDFIDASGGVNALTTSIKTSSSAAATFIGYLKNVSSGLATARQNATAAAAAMQAAGASMEQAQKAYHSYMTSLKSENALGISSQGGSGTGEGNVKIVAAKTTLTKTDPKSQNGWSVTTNINKNTINNNGDKLSTSKAKAAGV